MTYPVKLNNRLANLKLSIETGDGRPTLAAEGVDPFTPRQATQETMQRTERRYGAGGYLTSPPVSPRVMQR